MNSTPIDHKYTDQAIVPLMKQLVDDMMMQRQELVHDILLERGKSRRHKNVRCGLLLSGILFLAATYVYLFVVINGSTFGTETSAPYAAVIQIKGPIADGKAANAVSVGKALTHAFEDSRAKGVVLYINSPGGSPVQSSIIYDRIVALKEKYPDKRIVAVATDMVTSGAYFVASAADEIYVNRSTITGSIGVISSGFGFAEALRGLGIERRVFTAGAGKALLDPFKPLSESDAAKIDEILNRVHSHFIESVVSGRGDRLALEIEGLFEGEIWTGAEAAEIGLADGLGDLTTVLQNEFGVEIARDYTVKPAILERLMRFAVITAADEIAGHRDLSIR